MLDFSSVVVYDGGNSFVTMDIVKALRELHTEKKRLDAAIAALETRIKAGHAGLGKTAKGRRGRKSMSAAERLEVSRRMTLYWEARRAQPPSPAPLLSEGRQAGTASAS